MWRSSHAEGLSPKQQATGSHQLNNGGKRGRLCAGVSSPATGSSISERAVSQTSADSDGQDRWTGVKRRRRGRKQAGRQSALLAGNSRAKAELRAPPQQPETQPAEPLSAAQGVPPTSPTPQRRHPSRRQRRKRRRMEQQGTEATQTQPTSKVDSPATQTMGTGGSPYRNSWL